MNIFKLSYGAFTHVYIAETISFNCVVAKETLLKVCPFLLQG